MLIPDGSPVRGRVRRLEWNDDKGGYFVVGLEFTEIEAAGTRYRFFADLEGTDALPGIRQILRTRLPPEKSPIRGGADTVYHLRRDPLSSGPAGRGQLLRASPPARYPARFSHDLEDARTGTLKVPMVASRATSAATYNEVERFASEPPPAPAGRTCACAR